MATPKNINRDIGGVQPNNYVQQGVVDNSLGTAIKGAGAIALEVDRQVQTNRLDAELENLRTEYLTSAGPSKAVQDGVAMSDDDAGELARFSQEMQKGKRAAQQGRNITFDSYRIRGETLLRTAIARRPGLAEDFRRVASSTLGTDVVGASVLFLAEQEAAANQEQKDTRDEKRARDFLDRVGINNAGMTKDQVFAVYADPTVEQAVNDMMVLDSKVAQGEAMLTQRDQGVKLNRAANYVLAEGELHKQSQALYTGAVQLERLLFGQGQMPAPEQISAGVSQFKIAVQGVITKTRAAFVDTLPDEDIDKLLAGYQTTFDMLDKLASGEMLNEGMEAKLKASLGIMKMGVMNDPNVANMALVNDVFGPDVTTKLMDSNSIINNTMQQAVISVMSDEGQNPVVAATNAASVVSMFAEGLATQNDIQKAESAASVNRLPQRFLQVPDDKYNYSAYGAFVDKLALHRKSFARDMTPDQKQTMVAGLAQSTAHYISNLGKSIDTHVPYASLRGKVDIGLQENGNVVSMQPGQTYTSAERELIRGFNERYRVGPNVLNVMQDVGGLGPAEASKLVREAGKAAPKPDVSAASPPGTMEVTLGNGKPAHINQQGYEEWSGVALKKAEEYGISASVLTNIVTAESGWRVDAKSDTGVSGLAQVTKGTASRYGYDTSNYREPANQLDAAAQYLAFLHKKYKGDYNLAVTAYNVGEGHLDEFLETGARLGNLKLGGAYAAEGSSQGETYVNKVLGFEDDLLTYGRQVMGIKPPDDRSGG